MNTNVVISLDTRRAKKDGTYPLILRLGHNGRTVPIPLDTSLFEKDWDDEKKVIKKSYNGTESVSRLNNRIQKEKAKAKDIIDKLDDKNLLNGLSVIELKKKIVKTSNKNSFLEFGRDLIKELRKANRNGTADSYQDVISILQNYIDGKVHNKKDKKENKIKIDEKPKKDLSFNQVSFSFLTKFETHHLSKGNQLNGLAVYLRTIRAIYNKAIKAGLVDKESYPFTDYKIKTTVPKKRALDGEYLTKIIELKLEPDDICFHARNYFVASYMMYGMNYIDMAHLKRENIVNGRICYQRKKTSKQFDLKITDNLNAILSFYILDDFEYVFPIIKREIAFEQHKDVKWARKRYNMKLKILAERCGIETKLTSYVGRHSFATQAILNNVPINAVSAMLGHSSIKTTEVYIKSLPVHILDQYNLLVVEKIISL